MKYYLPNRFRWPTGLDSTYTHVNISRITRGRDKIGEKTFENEFRLPSLPGSEARVILIARPSARRDFQCFRIAHPA